MTDDYKVQQLELEKNEKDQNESVDEFKIFK